MPHYLVKPSILNHIRPSGHLLIEASAGTGKTYTIEHLVLDLILEGRATLDAILLVTFTVRATHDLRIRLRQTFERVLDLSPAESAPEEDHWCIDEEAKQRVRAALVDYDRAAIRTIHGFCQQVLAEHAFLCGRSLRLEVVDKHQAFQKAFYQALRTDFARHEPQRSLLVAWLHHHSLEDLAALLQRYCAADHHFHPWVSDEHVALFRASLPDLQTALSDPQQHRVLKAAMRQHKFKKDEQTRLREALRSLLRFRPDAWAECAAACDQSAILDGTFLPFLRRASQNPANPPLFAALVRLFERRFSFQALVLQTFAPKMRATLRRVKEEHGWIDHDDMLSAVRDALRSPVGPQLVAALGERYSIALIDEFQDTDAVQWEIFRRVFVEADPHGRRHRLVLIGDPKQAIYSFRGGDVYTYLEARRYLSEDTRTSQCLPLQDNYRSTAAMVRLQNTLFDQHRNPPFFSGLVRHENRVSCGRPDLCLQQADGQSAPPLGLFVLPGKELRKDDLHRAHLQALCAEIQRLLDPDAGLYLADKHGRRPLRAQDIFILARTGKDLLEVAQALRDAGIAYAYFRQGGLFQTTEAREVYELLQAVAHPNRLGMRLRAWYGPFFDRDLPEIDALRHLDERHPMVALLYRWHAIAQSERYDQLFATILRDSGIVRREILFANSERERTNYLHIFEVLLNDSTHHKGDIHQLIARLEHRIAQGDQLGDDTNIQRLEGERSAIQILTIHKAKGLEAAVVFLFGGLSGGMGAPPYIFHRDDGTKFTRYTALELAKGSSEERAHRAEAREEGQRLLYVALTRAKARLYLPYFTDQQIRTRALPHLREGIFEPLRQQLLHLTPDDALIEPISPSSFAPVVATPAQTAPLPPEPTLAPILTLPPGIYDRRLLITSYSRMKKSMPVEFRLPIANTPRERELPPGPRTGNFLHDLLEEIPFASLLAADQRFVPFETWRQDPAIAHLFTEKMHDRAMPATARDSAERVIYATLTRPVPLPPFAPISGFAATQHQLKEVDFTYPIPENHPARHREGTFALGVQRGWIKGYIDLVFSHEDRIFILDWKSDNLPDYTTPNVTEHVDTHYLWQMKLYALAVVRMLQISTRDAYEQRFGGVVYCFLRGMTQREDPSEAIFFARPTWSDIQAYTRELANHRFERFT